MARITRRNLQAEEAEYAMAYAFAQRTGHRTTFANARRCLVWRWLRDMASVLFLGRRRIKTATSNLGDLGRV
jgi:hypothetical protein